MIQPTLVQDAAAIVYNFLCQAEGFRSDLHDDSNDIALIGVGFNLESADTGEVREAVLSVMGISSIDATDTNGDGYYGAQLVAILRNGDAAGV